METFLHYLTFPFLWHGLLIAVEIAALALAGAFPLALGLAMMRLSKNRWVRVIPIPYIWLMRGTPILLQLIFWYDLLPQIGLRASAFATAVIGLGLNEVAFSGEIIRGGIQAVRHTQRQAAAALGMGTGLVLRRVVLPQALRSIAPALSNEAIVMIKNTSLASVIAVGELTLRSQEIVATNFLYVPVFLAAAMLYLVATSIVVVVQSWLERRMNVERKGAAVATMRVVGPTLAKPAIGEGWREEKAGRGRGLVRSLSGGDGVAHERKGEPFVVATDVSKAFHGKAVLEGISLTVHRGDVVVILGPSGSGKTTFLYTINHLEPINEGEIVIDGKLVGYRRAPGGLRPVRDLARARAEARIGMVFQQFNLFDHMTVLENIVEAPIRVYGMDARQVREDASALLAWAGLAGYEHYYPHQLSGGQQQRIAIARALACRPRLMLFDEPTSALDPELVGEVLNLIRELARAGMSMIVVTHEIAFARECADRIVFMADGRIVEEGPPAAVLERPREERTRQFLRLVAPTAP